MATSTLCFWQMQGHWSLSKHVPPFKYSIPTDLGSSSGVNNHDKLSLSTVRIQTLHDLLHPPPSLPCCNHLLGERRRR